MEHVPELTEEELRKLIEKAERDLQASLEKMTPEEREQAMKNAQKLIEEDRIEKQRLIDSAAAVLSQPSQTAKFCSHCGAPVQGGNFCSYCGSPLGNKTV